MQNVDDLTVEPPEDDPGNASASRPARATAAVTPKASASAGRDSQTDATLPSVLPGRLELVATARLQLAEQNPRRGDVAAIRESLRVNGQYRPLLVNRATMVVVAGNHTLLAARELGMPTLAVYLIDVGDQEALRIGVADNRIGDLAGYAESELAQLLSSLAIDDPLGLAGTGYNSADLDRLLSELERELPLPLDDLPVLPAKPVTRPGELIELGAHRLLCGDANDPAVFEQLLAGEPAEVLIADPPCGIGDVGRTPGRLCCRNGQTDALGDLLRSVFANAAATLGDGAPVYVFRPSGAEGLAFASAFLEQGWTLRQELIWLQDTPVARQGDYRHRHQAILYGYTSARGRCGRGGQGWYGDNKQTSVLEVPRPRAAREHPSIKPVELLATLIRNSSQRGATILDPFAGSGSTLLACELLGRRARLIELDPAFCDQTVERFERATRVLVDRHRE